MTFHLIVTCVAQKNCKEKHSILDSEIKKDAIENVFEQWKQLISNSRLNKEKAIDLYKGNLWNSYLDAWRIINGSTQPAEMWILSAGYGLINSEEKIVPYDITFQDVKGGVPSILTKIDNKSVPKKALTQNWWDLLKTSNGINSKSLQNLVGKGLKDDYFLIVLGKDYLDAVFCDLRKAINLSKYPGQIAIISNNVNDSVAKQFGPNWLYADNRFVKIPGINSLTVNADIAKQLLWNMFKKENGLGWWSHSNFNNFLKIKSSSLPDVVQHNRDSNTDDQIKKYIKDRLSKEDIPFSRMHRAFRDSGQACEYSRFKKLYLQVKTDFKIESLSIRPQFPVSYSPRKTNMQFFIPDWDDRVDPLYDFKEDIPVHNRDPYEHDTYHYELYGSLNCDGILVSKSVLEDNKAKKQRVQNVGIHRYLRLPLNVPVLGDCGAFNYVKEENPPYKTDEILNFYEDLGFNYGVSLDHLILPFIINKKKYYKHESESFIEIDETEFNEMKKNPDVKIMKHRGLPKQQSMFEKFQIIVEEKYTDTVERDRRYNITIENARKFMRGHQEGNYKFTPIGAVQGWDPESYASAVKLYQEMGYKYVALGSLVMAKTTEIIEILKCVDKIRKPETKVHMFGVARLEAINEFKKYGVASVDSAGMLRQAWLSSSNNYYSPDMNHYCAIRVPIAEKGSHSKKALKTGLITKDELLIKENYCLSLLRQYDNNEVSLEDVLESLTEYSAIMDGDPKFIEKYKRTLVDKPWKKCTCTICKKTGIDVIIFRRNNRNRRRGFHNTWLFYRKFKELTDCL